MTHQSFATVLGVTSLFPNSESILFSYPFDNGIRVLGFDDILSNFAIYYGDEIDLRFWKLLKIPFGQSNNPENPLTLQEGYLYKYYHKTKIFDVFDNNGTRIIHKTNVRTIAQMNIDFTIHKSHQFWIISDVNIDGHIFMFPAILRKDHKPINVEEFMQSGVQNIYVPDRVRPYLPTDIDNPTWDIKYIALYDEMQKWVRSGALLLLRKYNEQIYRGLHDYEAIDWHKNCPTNYFYMKELYELEVVNLPEDITKVPPFDPTKGYNEGDYVRGNTELTAYTLYKVMSSSCQTKTEKRDAYGNIIYDEHGNIVYEYEVDPYSFTYIIKNTARIFDIKIGKRYYVNDVIRTFDEEGKPVYYIVKTEFVMTDWEIDIVNTQKICTLVLEVKRFKRFTFFAEQIYLLYMQLGIGLYPDLMPIQRYDETQNNRPIYEPWLIWGFYKFLWNKKTNDWGDDEIPPLFDLSPAWA